RPLSSYHGHDAVRHLHSFPTRRSSDLEVRRRRERSRGRRSVRHPRGDLDQAFHAAERLGQLEELRSCDQRDRFLGRLCEERDHRSEEHTSELQSLAYLVCRLLLEKKKK